MVDRAYDGFGLWPERLIADAAYGSAPMLGWLVEERGDFAYDHDEDLYRCPGGKTLRKRQKIYRNAPSLVDANDIGPLSRQQQGSRPLSAHPRHALENISTVMARSKLVAAAASDTLSGTCNARLASSTVRHPETAVATARSRRSTERAFHMSTGLLSGRHHEAENHRPVTPL